MSKTPYNIKGKTVEYKSFPFQIKSIDEEQGTITGYLSTFGNVDLQQDEVQAGAFKKTIAEAYSRKSTGRKYLFSLLWMHSPEQPIGGFTEAQEDTHGLLCTAQLDISTNAAGIPNNPMATMAFSGFKAGFIDELSIGYIAIQKAYDGKVRILKEVQVLEGSAVVMLFAANPEALVPASGVKSLATKGVTGDTSLPIGPRNETWDSTKAEKQIFAYAKDGDEYDISKLHDCFLYTDGDPQLKGSWSYPYCYIKSGKPTICVGAITAIAGLIMGARGASAPDGLKAPIEKLYSRINKLYPDSPQLTPPWDDGKRRHIPMQAKDFNTLLVAAMQADCLEDWGDLINTLTQAMLQIFGMGDSPDPDMSDALAQFSTAVKEWNAKAIECDLAGYIADQGYCNSYSGGSNSPYVPYSLRVGYSSRHDNPATKAGATFSAANKEALATKAQELQDALAEHKSIMHDHVKSMQQKVSDLTQIWQQEGQGDPYTNDKSRMRREPLHALTRSGKSTLQPPASTDEVTLDDLEALLV